MLINIILPYFIFINHFYLLNRIESFVVELKVQ